MLENADNQSAFAQSMGGHWFGMDWKPMLESPEWTESLAWYLDIMISCGPSGASANGKCAMLLDATSAAGCICNPKESQVADKTAFTAPPFAGMALTAKQATNPSELTVTPVPYTGVQFVALPQFQGTAHALADVVT